MRDWELSLRAGGWAVRPEANKQAAARANNSGRATGCVLRNCQVNCRRHCTSPTDEKDMKTTMVRTVAGSRGRRTPGGGRLRWDLLIGGGWLVALAILAAVGRLP